MRPVAVLLLAVLVVVVVFVRWRRWRQPWRYPPADRPYAEPSGPGQPYRTLVEPRAGMGAVWGGAEGCEVLIGPAYVRGSQSISLQAGAYETVCTLSSYSDRVATGAAEPYLEVLLQPHARARLWSLHQGVYDLTIETGQRWNRAAREFDVPRGRHRLLRPLQLYGSDEIALTAEPVAGGDLPLTDA